MKHLLKAHWLLIPLLLIQCKSTDSVGGTASTEDAANRPEPNTVYKVFPDGERFLTSKKEYNDQGQLVMEYQLVARPEKKGDSSYYFHALNRAFEYRYDEDDRLVEKFEYYHDTSTVLYHDTYNYAGDSMVHQQETYDHIRDGELMFTRLKTKEWYEDGRLVKRFQPDGYRNDRFIESWEYDGDELLTYTIDNMRYQEYWYEGERIPDYAKKVIFYKDGKPVRDSIYEKEESGLVLNWILSRYDEYGTIYQQETTPDTDIWDEQSIPDPGSKFVRNITPNRLRKQAKDPEELLNAMLAESKTEMENFPLRSDYIFQRKWSIANGKIVTISDSNKPQPGGAYMHKREQQLSYNDQGQLIRTVTVSYFRDLPQQKVVEGFSYYPSGALRTKRYAEEYDFRKSRVVGYYEDGSQKYYAEQHYTQQNLPDSTVTLYDPKRGKELGKLQYLNGQLVSGKYNFYNDDGQLIQEFDEDEHSDVQYFYDSNGGLLRSEYYYISYDRYNVDRPFVSELRYELHYGPVQE